MMKRWHRGFPRFSSLPSRSYDYTASKLLQYFHLCRRHVYSFSEMRYRVRMSVGILSNLMGRMRHFPAVD